MQYIICFLLFIGTIHCSAQKIEDYSLKHSMKQDGLSMTFTVLDSDKKGIKHHDTQKTYYWYKSQTVLGTQGGSAGQLLHGAFESFYDNKQLCAKGNYAKGLKVGEWNYWQRNGVLIKTEHWSNGRQTGEQIQYSELGEVQKRTIIRGHKSTTENGDTLIEITKSTRTITLMDSIGRVTSIARYKNSLLHGKQETIASDGSKTVETYKNGEIVPEKEKKEKQKNGDQETNANGSEENKDGFFKRLKARFSKKEKSETTDKPAKEKKSKKEKKEPKSEKKTDSEDSNKKSFRLFKRKSE